MKTTAAVLYEMEKPAPYADSRPLRIEEISLDGPGPGEVLVEVGAAGLCHSDLSVINYQALWDTRNQVSSLDHKCLSFLQWVRRISMLHQIKYWRV